ncbi:MAG: glycosyltransferase [Limnochordia bacterium]
MVAALQGHKDVPQMRILMLVDSLALGGTETYVYTLAKELIARGHQIVIGTNGGFFSDLFAATGAPIEHLPFKSDNPLYTDYTGLLRRVRQIIKKYDIQLIHAHFIAGLKIGAQIAQETLLPLVMTVHGMFYPWRRLQTYLESCNQVIAVSLPVAAWLQRRIGLSRREISVIPNGIDTDVFVPGSRDNDFRQQYGISGEEKLITVCSRIAWGKTRVIETAMEVVDQLADTHPLRLVIVGSGPDSPFVLGLANQINRNHDKELILSAGAMLNPLEAYQASDVVVGTARVALEALSCQVPVLGAGNAGYFGPLTEESLPLAWEKYLGDHDYIMPLSARQFREDLLYLLEHGGLGERGRRWVQENFASEKIAASVEKLYIDLIEQGTVATASYWAAVTPTEDLPPVQEKAKAPPVKVLQGNLEDKPLVSVAIPAYNQGPYLQQCLAGLVEQTYRPLEIIVVDDGSTDNTAQVVEKWQNRVAQERALRLIYHPLPRNTGFAWAQSIAYFLSSGQFIANHDADDLSHPERLQAQMEFLQLNPDYSLVGTNYEVFTQDPNQRRKAYLVSYDHAIIANYREGKHCVCFGSLLFRRQVLEKIGGLTEFMKGAEDYEYVARAITQGFHVQNLRKAYYYYRDHADQRSKEYYGLRKQLEASSQGAGQ